MKIKEIIRPGKGGRIEDEKENDQEMTATVVISSLDYDDDNNSNSDDIKSASKKKLHHRNSIYKNEAAIDDDIVYHLNKKNNQCNVAFNDDYRYFSRSSMIDNAAFHLSDKPCNCVNNKYTTKKTLMLNDFWELNNIKLKTSNVQRYFTNEPATTTTTTTFVNRFVSEVANTTKCRLNGTTTSSSATSTVSIDNSAGNATVNSSCSLSSSSTTTVGDKGQSQSLCLSSSVLLTDKRLVGLFRSVALYWFFCLNTVLAKGDHVFKRRMASPLNEQLLLQRSTSGGCSGVNSMQSNLQLRICCPDVVLVVAGVGNLNNDDFLWDLEAALAAAENDAGSNLLTWADHSKARLFNDLFEKVLRDLADNCGIFKAIKLMDAEVVSCNRRIGEAKRPAESNITAEERRRISPSRPPSPVFAKKPNRSGKKTIGVKRKYIIDVLDYYYDDDDDELDDGTDECDGSGRASRTTTAVVNRIIWKKRAVKNKMKSKRKLANAGEQQHRRVQQIIIECYGSAAGSYVINDGYEEVVGASEKTIPSSSVAPVCPAVAIDDELYLDFDSYAENLKQEVAMRQLRKRKQPAPVVKIIEPTSANRAAISTVESNSIEDELNADTGSTSSSLVLELEEEESSSYFLPDGRYHSATQKYPKYDLWCSPLVVEKVWPAAEPAQLQPSSGNQTTKSGRIFKPAKVAAPPTAPAFKPYRLWESSWAPEDDFIPSFVAARRHRTSPKLASMVTTSGPAATKATATRRRPTFGKESASAAVQQSMYTLWGSPNIIDFLPGIGVSSGSSAGGSNSSINLNDGSCSSSRGASSSSAEETSSMEYEEYAPPSDTLHVLKTAAAAMNDPGRDAFVNHQHHSFNVRGGKFLNLKPIINGFVSFTDRGAFQYYKKPAVTAATTSTVISLALRSSRQIDSVEKVSEVSAVLVADASTGTDASDVEVKSIAMTSPRSDYDTPFHFKPIQPAFKVPTDTPASFERSESGTLWCNKRKLMTFKHELEDASGQQRLRSRDSVHELDSFQPKFVVNGNDVGCQTEWFGLNGFENTAMSMLGSQTTSFFASVHDNEKKNGQDPSYVSGAALLYAWDEVFNFLNKPGLGNIDVKAHLDFSCFF